MDDRGVAAERVTSYDHRIKQHARGRTCREPECRTRLSIYNDGDYCSVHEPLAAPRLRGKKIA